MARSNVDVEPMSEGERREKSPEALAEQEETDGD